MVDTHCARDEEREQEGSSFLLILEKQWLLRPVYEANRANPNANPIKRDQNVSPSSRAQGVATIFSNKWYQQSTWLAVEFIFYGWHTLSSGQRS